MTKTIAEILIETLVKAGVRRIHGLTGDSLNSLIDVVRRTDDIEWIHYRHEEAAAFAAGAEAQLTGQLAVCAGSCGPGNLHLINGLYDCHRSMAPVLAIAAHIPSGEIGTGYFQETHPDRLFQECSHYCELIQSAAQIPHVLHNALQYAVGKRGVSVIALSGDVAMENVRVNGDDQVRNVYQPQPVIRPAEGELQQVAKLLNDGKKVTILGGIGCTGAHDQVVALCERLKAPLVFALRGKDQLEYDNPYAVGMTGLIGYRSGNYAMENCDTLLMLGTDFPYRDWYPKKAKIIQIDLRIEHLGRRTHLDVGLVGDIAPTLEALMPMLAEKTDRSHLDDCLEQHVKSRADLDKDAQIKEGDDIIYPETLTTMLSNLANDDTVFTCDVGTPTVWAARYLGMTRERRLIGSFLHGSMASAMPQAIGAQLVDRNRQVIALSGDGGFAMLMGDFLTIMQYNLPIKIVVFNNSSLAFVVTEMKVAGLPPFGTDLKNPDFAKVASAMGALGVRVEHPDDLKGALEKALAHSGPALIDVVVNPTELSMPPKITLQEAWGFSLSMVKETLEGHGSEVVETIERNFLR